MKFPLRISSVNVTKSAVNCAAFDFLRQFIYFCSWLKLETAYLSYGTYSLKTFCSFNFVYDKYQQSKCSIYILKLKLLLMLQSSCIFLLLLTDESKSTQRAIDLSDLKIFLQSDNPSLISNAAGYVMHLAFNDEYVKKRIR